MTAVDKLSFHLDGGKIYGLLGGNGAGKSTLLSVLAVYCKPTSGRASTIPASLLVIAATWAINYALTRSVPIKLRGA